MKQSGYYIPYGYMGLVNETYILFATESEYIEYIKEENNDRKGNART